MTRALTPSEAVYAQAPDEVPDYGYLTARRQYLVTKQFGAFAFEAISDIGQPLYSRWEDSTHLDGGSWRRVVR